MRTERRLTLCRPEHLNLPEDSAFIPELDLNFDLSAFDLSSEPSHASSILSPYSFASSQTILGNLGLEEEAGLGLQLPSLNTPSGYGGFDVDIGGTSSVKLQSAIKPTVGPVLEESSILDDAEFEIAEDGSIVPVSRHQPGARQSEAQEIAGKGNAVSESGFSDRVRAEHEAGLEERQVSANTTEIEPKH